MKRAGKSNEGFTLIELLIAMLLGAVLITGISQLVLAAGSSYRLQQNLSAMQEGARFALGTMKQEIESAGYRQRPWDSGTIIRAITDLSADDLTGFSDRVSVQRWTDQNCFGNFNTIVDEFGFSRFYLRQSDFSINGSGNLAMTCRYGPSAGQLTTQLNNLGLVENAESFQALYAEDSDADGNADRWVSAGQWLDESRVLAVRLGLVLSTPESIHAPAGNDIQVLNAMISPANDGRLRRVFESSAAVKERNR